MRKALLAGTYDPITIGHLDLIYRASLEYDKVTVGIFCNPDKTCLFSSYDRCQMILRSVEHLPNVSVLVGAGYTADYAKNHGYTLFRGYRNEEDLAYEEEMAAFNYARGGVKTDLRPTAPHLAHISSTAVRQAYLAGDLSAVAEMVPEGCFEILVALREKM